LTDETGSLSGLTQQNWTFIVKPLVLIVEDEALVRLVAASMLQDAGFDTLEADTAEDALHVLEEHADVRVLFSDVQLPGAMDGLDLAHLVHDRWPDIGLLLTSGGVTVRPSEIPDDGDFLPKPYDGIRMVEAVRKVM
jgi:CheY-like chemotaxis protein